MKNIQNIYDNKAFFAGYKALRDNEQGFNNLIEQQAIISLLPELKNKDILDIGCGFGDFSRFAIKHGAASVIAIDPSHNMLQEAIKRTDTSAAITFQQVAIENFTHPANAFDLIVSSLAFHYVEDFTAIMQKITTWLKPHGMLIFSVEHPICTAYPEATIKTDEQGREFHPVYNYRDEGIFSQTWLVPDVRKYHRTLSTYINTLINHHLKIEIVLEPMPTDDVISKRKDFAMHKIRPPLLVIKATK